MKIVASSSYLPKNKVTNKEIAKNLGIEESFIEKRTGIKQRYFVEEEKIEEIAKKAVEKLINKVSLEVNEIDLIIVATTSTNKLMPGISNYIQKELGIKKCICLDILAGCSGYVNATDIAHMYINSGKVKKAIVVGVEVLSKKTNKEDIGTAIILSDGAGATLFEKTEEDFYFSNIEAIADKNNILTCNTEGKIFMDGLAVYKYAVTETVKNIKELLEGAGEKLENIKYIIPHQSNLKIMNAIASRLNIENKKIYTNIENIGNTFCASIPIVLEEMQEKKLLQKNDKIVIIGYGAGLNTGSILLKW